METTGRTREPIPTHTYASLEAPKETAEAQPPARASRRHRRPGAQGAPPAGPRLMAYQRKVTVNDAEEPAPFCLGVNPTRTFTLSGLCLRLPALDSGTFRTAERLAAVSER